MVYCNCFIFFEDDDDDVVNGGVKSPLMQRISYRTDGKLENRCRYSSKQNSSIEWVIGVIYTAKGGTEESKNWQRDKQNTICCSIISVESEYNAHTRLDATSHRLKHDTLGGNIAGSELVKRKKWLL